MGGGNTVDCSVVVEKTPRALLIDLVREAISVGQPSRIRVHRVCSRRDEWNRVATVGVRRNERKVAFVGRLPGVDQALPAGREIGTTFGVGGGDQRRGLSLAGVGIDVFRVRRLSPDEADRSPVGQQPGAVNFIRHLDQDF